MYTTRCSGEGAAGSVDALRFLLSGLAIVTVNTGITPSINPDQSNYLTVQFDKRYGHLGRTYSETTTNGSYLTQRAFYGYHRNK